MPATPPPATDPTPVDSARTERWANYRQQLRQRWWIIAGLAVITVFAALCDLITGPAGLSLQQIWHGLWAPETLSRPLQVILWDVRLPLTLMALLTGASLALAGVEMQAILNNPLAEPFTLGVSSSAALGAALAIVLGWTLPWVPGHWLVPVNAFLFALGSLALLQFLAYWRGLQAQTLVLFGIAIGFAAGAMLALLQFIAREDTLQQLVFWNMGSLARADWQSVAILAAVLALILPFSLKAAVQLTALRLGEERAQSFGINVKTLRRWSLLRISLLAATAVAFVGTIGFVGLVGPHLARLMVGDNHKYLLPASILAGAAMLALASLASKLLVPGITLPLGIVTALVGLPVFMGLMLRPRGARP